MLDLIKAFEIFSKYEKGRVIHCEHDIMYVCVNPSIVSTEDKATLEEFGFNEDEESFTSYRYGSC